MKKIVLTSLLAMFAVSGVHAANIIDGNPLYMPKAGHFYSETMLGSHTDNVDVVGLGEEFGYGITDRLSVAGMVVLSEDDWFHAAEWDAMGIGLTYRFVDNAHWKWDVMGSYAVGPVWSAGGHKFLHGSFLDKHDTEYDWTVGLRTGYTEGDFTIAGHVMMDYYNTESFNWDHKGFHTLNAGLDAQLVLTDKWNLVAGAEYEKSLNRYNDFLGSWELMFGANYNIDATKYIGAFITKDVQHIHTQALNGVQQDGHWEFQDGFGIGAKFGIDF